MLLIVYRNLEAYVPWETPLKPKFHSFESILCKIPGSKNLPFISGRFCIKYRKDTANSNVNVF